MPGWIAALAIALITFLGALTAGLLPRYLSVGRSDFEATTTAVAAGLLLASALVIVIPEGFEVLFLSHPSAVSYPDTFFGLPKVLASGLAILTGFLLMLGLESKGMGHELPHRQSPIRMLSVGLGLHALTDGIALGASVATELLVITLPILAAVMVHKVPVAFTLGTFLWQKRQAKGLHPFRILLLFSLATPSGLLITFLFLRHLPYAWISLMLLFSGGTFLYVAAVDVLGRVLQEQAGMRLFSRVGLGVILLIIALILLQVLGFEAELHG